MILRNPFVDLLLDVSIDILRQVFELIVHFLSHPFENILVNNYLVRVNYRFLELLLLILVDFIKILLYFNFFHELLVFLIQRVELNFKTVGFALLILNHPEPNMIEKPQNLLFREVKHPRFDFEVVVHHFFELMVPPLIVCHK